MLPNYEIFILLSSPSTLSHNFTLAKGFLGVLGVPRQVALEAANSLVRLDNPHAA